MWEDSTLRSKPSFSGCLVSGSLSLEGFTLDDHNTKVYWPTQFRKCLVCPSSQKLLETRDLSVPLPQWCYRGTAKGPAVLCSLCCVQSVSDRVKAASICAPCHYKSGEDNEAALLSRATLPHSDHSTVWWTESPQPFFFSPFPPPPNLETEVSLGLDRFLCKQIVCGKRWKKSPAWSGFHNPDENKRAWRAV